MYQSVQPMSVRTTIGAGSSGVSVPSSATSGIPLPTLSVVTDEPPPALGTRPAAQVVINPGRTTIGGPVPAQPPAPPPASSVPPVPAVAAAPPRPTSGGGRNRVAFMAPLRPVQTDAAYLLGAAVTPPPSSAPANQAAVQQQLVANTTGTTPVLQQLPAAPPLPWWAWALGAAAALWALSKL